MRVEYTLFVKAWESRKRKAWYDTFPMSLFFLAIAAGFLTILAPCILPMLPFLLGTSGGKSHWRPVAIIAGFVGSFSILGATFATVGTLFGVQNNTLRIAAAILLMLFGAALLFEHVSDRLILNIQPLLTKLGAGISGNSAQKADALSGLLVGASLGLIWSPCAGPILGTILTLAARTHDFATTFFLFFAYAIGAALPMFGVAYGSHAIQKRLHSTGRLQPVLNKIFGVFIILTAIGILTGYDRVVQTWLIQWYPTSFLL